MPSTHNSFQTISNAEDRSQWRWRSRWTWLILWSLAAAPPGLYAGVLWGALVQKEWSKSESAELFLALMTAPVMAAAALGSAWKWAFPEQRKYMIRYMSEAWGEAPAGEGDHGQTRKRVISGFCLAFLTVYVLSMFPFMVLGGSLSAVLSPQAVSDPVE